jgi:hypothetical protein
MALLVQDRTEAMGRMTLHRIKRHFYGLLCAVLVIVPISAQSTSESDSRHKPDVELKNTRLVILKGTIVPSRTMEVNGKSLVVPEMCGFRFHNPADSPPLGWRQLGETLFHKDTGTCEGAFVEGEVVQASEAPKEKG